MVLIIVGCLLHAVFRYNYWYYILHIYIKTDYIRAMVFRLSVDCLANDVMIDVMCTDVIFIFWILVKVQREGERCTNRLHLHVHRAF